jgi:hypothetical protein
MNLLRIPSIAHVKTSGAEGLQLLAQSEQNSQDALLGNLNEQERRLIVARLRHIQRLRRDYLNEHL